MTLAFVGLLIGYLAVMLHGKRLSAPRPVAVAENHNGGMQIGWPLGVRDGRSLIVVSTQHNAHPPVS